MKRHFLTQRNLQIHAHTRLYLRPLSSLSPPFACVPVCSSAFSLLLSSSVHSPRCSLRIVRAAGPQAEDGVLGLFVPRGEHRPHSDQQDIRRRIYEAIITCGCVIASIAPIMMCGHLNLHTPRVCLPRHATSSHSAPRHAAPRSAAPRRTTPGQVTPHHAAAHPAPPHPAAMPCLASPRHAGLRHVAPRHAAPCNAVQRPTLPRQAAPCQGMACHALPRQATLQCEVMVRKGDGPHTFMSSVSSFKTGAKMNNTSS